MLNKEQKQITENIKKELTPLFKKAEKLGEKLRIASSETRKAHNIATAWQYPTVEGYALECGEDSKLIQKKRNENPQEWHEILKEKYNILGNAQALENVARLNYKNYIRYICIYISNILHTDDLWASFYEKKGLESLFDELKTITGKSQSVSIWRDGGGFYPFGDPNAYFYYKITFWGACGVCANCWESYTERKKGSKKEWERPTEEPKQYTFKQYIKIVSDLKKLENEAKDKAREHHRKAQETGLIYFIGGLSDPQLNIWGKND